MRVASQHLGILWSVKPPFRPTSILSIDIIMILSLITYKIIFEWCVVPVISYTALLVFIGCAFSFHCLHQTKHCSAIQRACWISVWCMDTFGQVMTPHRNRLRPTDKHFEMLLLVRANKFNSYAVDTAHRRLLNVLSFSELLALHKKCSFGFLFHCGLL